MILDPKIVSYRTEVFVALVNAGVPRRRLEDLVRVEIEAHRDPGKRPGDLDNLLKVALDSLVKNDLLADDRQIDDVRIYRGVSVPGGRLDVVVERLEA